jgi:hypothetical protein
MRSMVEGLFQIAKNPSTASRGPPLPRLRGRNQSIKASEAPRPEN